MLNTPIINLVILLSFIYFIGSLLVSTINEAIASVFNLRGKTLNKGINNLLFHEDWKTYVNKEFLTNPFIESLMKKPHTIPSYIPAKNFALAILEHCKFYNCCDNPEEMKKAVASCILPASMRNIITAMLDHTQGNVKKMQEELERFYDNAMDRISGWYKKKIQVIIILISFFLAAFLNIDTILIIRDSLKDKVKLEATVDRIAETLPSIQSGESVINIVNGEDTVSINSLPSNNKMPAQAMPTTSPTLATLQQQQETAKGLTILYKNTTERPVGYLSIKEFNAEWFSSPAGFLRKFIGVMLTAFAIQMGSNYWFDLLNKFVNLRGSGKKPKETN